MGNRSRRHHDGTSASATRTSNLGVTTIIDYGKDEDETALDLENQQHRRKGSATSETSGEDGWDRHSNQSSISYGRNSPNQRGSGGGSGGAPAGNPWQITVKQSIVQTRDLD